ncbi:MAG: aromatic ring-hydroxylating dioxygenase subunit alpha [Zavarzinella sp.]
MPVATTDFDQNLPLERASALPAPWYTSPEIYQQEISRIFHDSWLMVGTQHQFANVGSYQSLEIAGEPIALIQQDTGEITAQSNVCRHRAAVLLPSSHGECSRIRCPYHGWTYDLQGNLRGTPEFEGVQDFSKESCRLPQFQLTTTPPWLWLHLGTPQVSADEVLAPFLQWWNELPIQHLQHHRQVEYIIECNWKIFIDNYLDGGYHVHAVHPALADVLDYSQYRTDLHPWCNVQSSPLKPGDAANPASTTRAGGTAYYWWLWPNVMVNYYPGILDTNTVYPLGVDRCRVVFDYYFSPEHSDDFREQSIGVAHQIQLEDLEICESVQRGLQSRHYHAGRYSAKREAGAHHFHRLMAQALQ